MKLSVTAKALFFILLSFVVFPGNGYTQAGFRISAGYEVNRGSYTNLNWVINNYNEIRNFLTDEMDEIHMMHGPVVHVGYEHRKFGIFEAGFSTRKGSTFAQGVDNSAVLKQRNVSITRHSLDIGFCYPVTNGWVRLATGINNAIGMCKVSTLLETPEEVNKAAVKDYYEVQQDLVYTLQLFLKTTIGNGSTSPFRGELQAFYTLSPTQVDFVPLNEEINAYSAANDPQVLRSGFGGFGFKAALVILLASRGDD